MKKSIPTVVIAAALLVPQQALAHDCAGTVHSSYLVSDGSVIIRGTWRNDYTQVCNLKTEWKGITPDICAGWKAMFDAAVSLGRSVSVYYSPDVPCSTIPYYGSAPAPYYVMLL